MGAHGWSRLAPREEHPWRQLVSVALVQFAVAVDFFGLTVALPSIAEDLDAGTADLQWMVNAYMLAMTVALVGAGRLGDLVGRRRVMLVGTLAFAAGSLISGLAQAPGPFIAGRFLAGLGAALITAAGLAVVAHAFGEDERSSAIGAWAAVGALGSAVGPLIGGVLTQGASWRWIFLLNAPMAVVTAVLVVVFVVESRDDREHRLDVAGLATLTVGLTLVVFALLESSDLGWGSAAVLLSMGAGALLLAAMVRIEARAAEPLVDLGIFRGRRYTGTALVAFGADFAFAAVMFYLTLYLQLVRDLSPAEAGAVFLVFTLTYIAVSPAAGWGVRQVGIAPLMGVGMGLLAVGATCFALLDVASGAVLLVLGLAITGMGQGLAFNTSEVAGVGAVPPELVGEGSGVIAGIRQLGNLTGLAVTAALFNVVEVRALARDLAPVVGDQADAIADEAASGLTATTQGRPGLSATTGLGGEQLDQATDDAFLTAMAAVMVLVAVVSVVGVAGAWMARGVGSATERRPPG